MPDLTPIQKLGDQFLLFLPTLIGAVALFVVFWIAGGLVASGVNRVTVRARFDPIVRKLLTDVVRLTILCVGGITALGTLGIDVSALVAGLGLTSLALGLALQDIVRNAVSGMFILVYRPFKLGDTINIAGAQGIVVSVDLRYTVLQGEGQTLLVPNQNVFSNVVVINRLPDERRIIR